jgi:hypothetical protein
MVFFRTSPNQSHIVKKNTISDNGFVVTARRLQTTATPKRRAQMPFINSSAVRTEPRFAAE